MQRQAVDRGHRQRAEHRDVVEDRDLRIALLDRGVDRPQAPPGERRERRRDEAEREHRGLYPEQVDGERGDERTRGPRQRRQAPLDADPSR
jgi:hypothetical protein